ncbi:hypothetical protein AB4099_32555 [Bosea sp. 2KB_26]|uniref:hypothetical protein n=1 Tax=Bosea sp. 2KB_26 TaxID=3237475 RepID=UPI003F91242D
MSADVARHVQLAIVATEEGAAAAFAINTEVLKEDIAARSISLNRLAGWRKPRSG